MVMVGGVLAVDDALALSGAGCVGGDAGIRCRCYLSRIADVIFVEAICFFRPPSLSPMKVESIYFEMRNG
jgi:hypothetical protein